MADLTDPEIFDAFKGGFKPLDCHAEYGDYRNRVKFSVRGPNGEEISTRSIPLGDVRSKTNLDTVIENERDIVRAKGYKLNARP
jgi:hypothetical protein